MFLSIKIFTQPVYTFLFDVESSTGKKVRNNARPLDTVELQ